jgi:hypothetical protein
VGHAREEGTKGHEGETQEETRHTKTRGKELLQLNARGSAEESLGGIMAWHRGGL